ncbi:MAG: hypothetical protein ABI720_10800 [Actinomycetes bacterium]
MGDRQLVARLLVATCIALASGCTSSPQAPDATDRTTSGSSASATATTTTTSDSSGAPSTPVDPQEVLDEAVATMLRQDSVGFTGKSVNVIKGNATQVTTKGAWTRNPLAWKTTTTLDPEKPNQATLYNGAMTVRQVHVGSKRRSVLTQLTFPRSVLKQLNYQGPNPFPWSDYPGYTRRPDESVADLATPPSIRVLTQITARDTSSTGNTVAVVGTIRTYEALSELGLYEHMGELGYSTSFADSTTRVLVTIGAAGTPTSLEFSGSAVDLAGIDVADYVVDEIATASYLAEYGAAQLKGPITAPDPQTVP